jgi:putative endonuclease
MNSEGALAEEWAAHYLERHGLKLIERNYRGRFGEIDLIMQDGITLVFVEVRLRKNTDFGGAAASIDTRKQRRIIRTSQQYLSNLVHTPACRFDVVLIGDTQGMNAQWLRNAFDAFDLN